MSQNTSASSPTSCGAHTCTTPIPSSSSLSATSVPKDNTTVVAMPSPPLPSRGQYQKDDKRAKTHCGNDQRLKSLGSHLDLLTAGTLFLLPSTLPFVASALTSYASDGLVSFWAFAWIMSLPCIGVLLPLAAFKIMTSLENQSNHTSTSTSTSKRQRRESWVMACPITNTIKVSWKTLKGDHLGYGPLALDTSNSSSSSLYGDSDDDSRRQYKGIRTSSLPRPKTIIVVSLGIWTLLMALSASLGLNTITVTKTTASERKLYLGQESLEKSSSWTDKMHLSGLMFREDRRVNTLSVLDIDKAEDQDSEQDREEGPFVTIPSAPLILNKGDKTHASEGEDATELDLDDFMDPDALDALTLDPEDASVFQNFLSKLKVDDATTKEADASADNAPCGHEDLEGTPDLANRLFGKINGIAQSYITPREQGQVFDYIAGWTEMMIFLSALCMGGLFVGLGQARELRYQLLERQEVCSRRQQRQRVSLVTVVACILIAGLALGLTLMMIVAEAWDLPSVQFVGLGFAGMILAHARIPGLPLQLESAEDVYMNKYESEDEDDNQLEEKTRVRRNACSLEENRRWDLTSCRV